MRFRRGGHALERRFHALEKGFNIFENNIIFMLLGGPRF